MDYIAAPPASALFSPNPAGVPIIAVTEASLADAPAHVQALAKAQQYKAGLGALLVDYHDGAVRTLYVGLGKGDSPFFLHQLAQAPAGHYVLADVANFDPDLVALGHALSAYRFGQFRAAPDKLVTLHIAGHDVGGACALCDAINMGRELVNLPPNVLGPDAMEAVATQLAKDCNAHIEIITGEALAQGYPLIEAVGKAAQQAPRLLVLSHHPASPASTDMLAIVGKGVTFDSGGLDIKPASGMALMKKDMGGAACALALFRHLVTTDWPTPIKCYVPVVENAIAGNAFRPGDIYRARNGLSIEIDNTDAEGRLILADALTKAVEDGAKTIVDFATLTGAARIALGPEVTPFYTNDDGLAAAITAAATSQCEPLWRMPLYAPYLSLLDSHDADMKNSGGSSFAGSVTAALFLQKFVGAARWVHLDTYCWNPSSVPTRPKHGDIHGVRAIAHALKSLMG